MDSQPTAEALGAGLRRVLLQATLRRRHLTSGGIRLARKIGGVHNELLHCGFVSIGEVASVGQLFIERGNLIGRA